MIKSVVKHDRDIAALPYPKLRYLKDYSALVVFFETPTTGTIISNPTGPVGVYLEHLDPDLHADFKGTITLEQS